MYISDQYLKTIPAKASVNAFLQHVNNHMELEEVKLHNSDENFLHRAKSQPPIFCRADKKGLWVTLLVLMLLCDEVTRDKLLFTTSQLTTIQQS